MRRLATGLMALAALVGPATAQTPARKTEDALQAERRKLQQTEQQLREERRRAAEARARESSLLAELEKIEQRLAAKQPLPVLPPDELHEQAQGVVFEGYEASVRRALEAAAIEGIQERADEHAFDRRRFRRL